MKKIIRKFFLLFLLFVFSVTGSALLLNSETTDDRTDMNESVLPEVMVEFGDVLCNRMAGYRQKMEADFVRDSLTPMDTTKTLTFVINPYDTEVNSLAYEIRTSDGSKVIENRKIKNLDTRDSYFVTEVQIDSDLRMNQEYSMQLTLETGEGLVYYYTRIISRSNLHIASYTGFVQSFYEKAMDKTASEDLATYLESSVGSTTRNFANVTISSKLTDISWGSLSPQIVQRGIPMIKDINETTASVSLTYQISAKDDNGNTELYDVTEFYRMRYTDERIMLLDFSRSAQQVFQALSSNITDDGLLLGVRDKEVQYLLNEESDTIVFVQNGDLFSYSPDDGKFVRIFSFRQDTNSDSRDTRAEHGIKLIRVSENGDVDFVLYGYMNRGVHEGMSGLCAYHYSNDSNAIEEKVFIPSTKSYEFLEKDLGTLSYVNEENALFLVFNENLCKVDIDAGTYEILESGVDSESFVVSDSSAHAAWILQTEEQLGTIREIDLDTLEIRDIIPDEGDVLRTVGFMNEDLIYGSLHTSDVIIDSNGRTMEGMYNLLITSFDGTVKKEYRKDGLYIMNSSINGTMMEFELASRTDQGYSVVQKDNIMNTQKAASAQLSIELVTTTRRGVIVRLGMSDIPDTDQALSLYAKQKNQDVQTITVDAEEDTSNYFYVYAYGRLDTICTDPAEAVQIADSKMGVVLNRSQQYIWERGNKKDQVMINTPDIPDAFLTGSLDVSALIDALGEEGTVLDLSGCTLDEVLYEVSAGRPVITKTGDQSSVIIVGYDSYNTWLFDPTTGETYAYGMNDSTELFESTGNIFISYIEAVSY